MKEIFIDATDHVLGRLASYVAKMVLEGNKVYIVNAEKVVITGKWKNVLEEYKHKIIERGHWYKGPFYPKRPDRIVRRVIRGMLPKNYIGKEALKRVKVYIGIPDELKGKEFITIEKARIDRINRRRKIWYVYLGEVSKQLGAKF